MGLFVLNKSETDVDVLLRTSDYGTKFLGPFKPHSEEYRARLMLPAAPVVGEYLPTQALEFSEFNGRVALEVNGVFSNYSFDKDSLLFQSGSDSVGGIHFKRELKKDFVPLSIFKQGYGTLVIYHVVGEELAKVGLDELRNIDGDMSEFITELTDIKVGEIHSTLSYSPNNDLLVINAPNGNYSRPYVYNTHTMQKASLGEFEDQEFTSDVKVKDFHGRWSVAYGSTATGIYLTLITSTGVDSTNYGLNFDVEIPQFEMLWVGKHIVNENTVLLAVGWNTTTTEFEVYQLDVPTKNLTFDSEVVVTKLTLTGLDKRFVDEPKSISCFSTGETLMVVIENGEVLEVTLNAAVTEGVVAEIQTPDEYSFIIAGERENIELLVGYNPDNNMASMLDREGNILKPQTVFKLDGTPDIFSFNLDALTGQLSFISTEKVFRYLNIRTGKGGVYDSVYQGAIYCHSNTLLEPTKVRMYRLDNDPFDRKRITLKDPSQVAFLGDHEQSFEFTLLPSYINKAQGGISSAGLLEMEIPAGETRLATSEADSIAPIWENDLDAETMKASLKAKGVEMLELTPWVAEG